MKQIVLTQGKFAIVDDADFESLNQFKWYAQAGGQTFYAARRVLRDGVSMLIYMHRVIMRTPQGREIDHLNHNGLDNKRANLRECSRAENHHNQIPTKAGTSKYKGVCWNKRYKRWAAQIRVHYKSHWLGYFKDETEAAKAYNKKAKELFEEFAHFNKIESEVA